MQYDTITQFFGVGEAQTNIIPQADFLMTGVDQFVARSPLKQPIGFRPAAESTSASHFISPDGGKLVDLIVPVEARELFKAQASELLSIQLSERAVCDLALLATGAFSPLDCFMGQADFESMLDTMRLVDGTFFPIPVTLPIDPGDDLCLGQQIALRDSQFDLLGVMRIDEMYEWDHVEVAQKVFDRLGMKHLLIEEMAQWGKFNLSGPMQVLPFPKPHDFVACA